MVEHEREAGQRGEDCGVTKHQHTVVDGDGDEVEDAGEDRLDH